MIAHDSQYIFTSLPIQTNPKSHKAFVEVCEVKSIGFPSKFTLKIKILPSMLINFEFISIKIQS